MNKIYKVVWSEARNCYVVVSELAKRKVRAKSLVAAVLIAGVLAAGAVDNDILPAAYAAENRLDYVTNDDSMKQPFDAPPVIVNYFYHEQIKKSARKGGDSRA